MLYENKIYFVQLSLFLMVSFRHMMSLDVLTGTGACKYDVHKLKPRYTETRYCYSVSDKISISLPFTKPDSPGTVTLFPGPSLSRLYNVEVELFVSLWVVAGLFRKLKVQSASSSSSSSDPESIRLRLADFLAPAILNSAESSSSA